ncbi:MAG TPA: diaminopimelate epimerase [Candidatus Caccousia avicola]|uniref:Diaminopimelate epimerase n=1 Tax=Candidatus Caccousia avicola TaxID=2840721 RepID=A0A9D1DFU8_9FIRM|nr:diaminopimelate epimerase [Candidatus Caccousia avicola]
MKFTKMHGIGNDYIYVNCFEEGIPADPAALSRRLSDRHFGIGSDGLILIRPTENGDAMMDLYNADGSRAMMCGNGIRCVGRYVYERGIAKKETLRIDTLSGVKTLHLDVANGMVQSIEVDMGEPVLEPASIPVLLSGERAVSVPVEMGDDVFSVTCVSMGNPHCVLFVEDVDALDLEELGPRFEWNPLFPQGVNTEFIQPLPDGSLKMRVWERGSGETWACGTGACASVVAACLCGKAERQSVVHLRGGDLSIHWREEDGHVMMRGPAAFVFDGEIDLSE